jgi:hypothetical protein
MVPLLNSGVPRADKPFTWFKMLGQIIARSICQGCAGFPYMASSMFYYFATGDIGQASAYASIADIFNDEELYYVEKVIHKFSYVH